ncbi:MAG: elongation factor EF-2 [Promethearchaeota archaeon]
MIATSYRAKKASEILAMMQRPNAVRNVALVGHIDHGKTTLSDSLIAEAGLLSEELAGEARVLDYLEEEQRRGITMKAANISLYYEKSLEEPFLINLVDTPGHLDFSGKVARALRLVDGVVVIVDCVEEVSAQSETVVRQALGEGVKPLLFINKIDRLFKELRLKGDEIRAKLDRIISKFNDLVEAYADPPFNEQWQVAPANGDVMFGSALDRWGFTTPQFVKMGWKFSTLAEKYRAGEQGDLRHVFPVHDAVLRAVVELVPDPVSAQSYRMAKIWGGDLDGPVGRALASCDSSPDAPLVVCFSKVQVTKHGLLATGRVFSGTLERGRTVYLVRAGKRERVQQVSIYMGARRDHVERIPAGNIAAVGGLKHAKSGETLVAFDLPAGGSEELERSFVPFEPVSYVVKPVMTVAIEPERLRDLPNLHKHLERFLVEDPNLSLSVSEETGEVLLSGLGPLHLEVVTNEINKAGLAVVTSKPLPVFREGVAGRGGPVEARSSNGANRVVLWVDRVPAELVEFFAARGYPAGVLGEELRRAAVAANVLSEERAATLFHVDPECNLLSFELSPDDTAASDARELTRLADLLAAACKEGPLCKEPVRETWVTVTELELAPKEDDRNDAELGPMIMDATFGAAKQAGQVLLEPIYSMEVQFPPEMLGVVTNLVAQVQAKVVQLSQESHHVQAELLVPVRESVEFLEKLRSVTSGRALGQYQFHSFQNVPPGLQKVLVADINFRKGAVVEDADSLLSLGEIDFDEY